MLSYVSGIFFFQIHFFLMIFFSSFFITFFTTFSIFICDDYSRYTYILLIYLLTFFHPFFNRKIPETMMPPHNEDHLSSDDGDRNSQRGIISRTKSLFSSYTDGRKLARRKKQKLGLTDK